MNSKLQSTLQVIPPVLPGKRIQQKIKSEIILGAPSSGCQGVGICRVMAYGSQKTYPCQRVTAWISVTETGTISISFLKSEMSPRFQKRHFGWMLFQVFEPYEMPGGISQALGFDSVLLRPGIYPVWESPHFLTVDF